MKRKYYIPLQWELNSDFEYDYNYDKPTYFCNKTTTYKFTLYLFGIPVFYLYGRKKEKIRA